MAATWSLDAEPRRERRRGRLVPWLCDHQWRTTVVDGVVVVQQCRKCPRERRQVLEHGWW